MSIEAIIASTPGGGATLAGAFLLVISVIIAIRLDSGSAAQAVYVSGLISCIIFAALGFITIAELLLCQGAPLAFWMLTGRMRSGHRT